jgi:hypothetical protein
MAAYEKEVWGTQGVSENTLLVAAWCKSDIALSVYMLGGDTHGRSKECAAKLSCFILRVPDYERSHCSLSLFII